MNAPERVAFQCIVPAIMILPLGCTLLWWLVPRIALQGHSGEGFAGLAAGIIVIGSVINTLVLFGVSWLIAAITIWFKDSSQGRFGCIAFGVALHSMIFVVCAAAGYFLLTATGVMLIPISK